MVQDLRCDLCVNGGGVLADVFGAQVCSVVRWLFGCGLVSLLVVLIVTFLSFLAMPSLCCFLRLTQDLVHTCMYTQRRRHLGRSDQEANYDGCHYTGPCVGKHSSTRSHAGPLQNMPVLLHHGTAHSIPPAKDVSSLIRHTTLRKAAPPRRCQKHRFLGAPYSLYYWQQEPCKRQQLGHIPHSPILTFLSCGRQNPL